MAAKYRIVRTDFWSNPVVSEEMSPEEKYFYLYLLTGPNTTQIGIYPITKKQMAFDLGYSIEMVQFLLERFMLHFQLICYNPETRELGIKHWGKFNLQKVGKLVMDFIYSELKEVEDLSLIEYVSKGIPNKEIVNLYKSFYENGITGNAHDPDLDVNNDTCNDTSSVNRTIRGQKEKEEEKEKEKQQQIKKEQQLLQLRPKLILNPKLKPTSKTQHNKKQHDSDDVKYLQEFYGIDGFGFANLKRNTYCLSG